MDDIRGDVRMDEYREADKNQTAELNAYYIPARAKEEIYQNTKIRVCAYCRVSTDSDAQSTSFVLQREHYQNLTNVHPNWILKHIYADEGISGTSLKRRDEFNKMIAACRAGEYDLIVTKSVSRFARNLVDCISLARELKNQNPRVGIYFETDGLNTLMEDSELRLSILASFAQEESVKKSESMVWSLKERFKNKKLLTPELYGYRRPRDAGGHFIKGDALEIDTSEAAVVKFIYDSFLAGSSTENISATLTDLGIPTKIGNPKWSAGSVNYILRNERYCGSVLTWKTFTYDIFEHKKRKNKKDRDQYLYKAHHPAIVTVEQYEAVQALLEAKHKGMRGGLHYMHVVDEGIFRGYVPIDHRWINDDPDIYFQASESVQEDKRERLVRRSCFSHFDLSGYQVVRGQYLTARSELPGMSIFENRIVFNSSCGNKLKNFSYIQLLLHPTERKMAIRPCGQNDVFSIYWNTKKVSLNKTIFCPYFGKALFRIMEWDPEFHYRVFGTWIKKDDDCIMIFNLTESVPFISYKENSSNKKRETAVCPEGWGDTFGEEFYHFSLENNLYYSREKAGWNSRTECKCIEEHPAVRIMSPMELKECAAGLKRKTEQLE